MIEWFRRRWASRALLDNGPGLRPRFAGAGGGSASTLEVGRGAYGRIGRIVRVCDGATMGGVETASTAAGTGGRFARLGGLQLAA